MMLAMALAWTGPAAAETHAWGWRGDGTGRFPDADPPVKWGRISKTMKDLRDSADRLPEGALAKARTMEQGTVSEWLILGPVAADSEANVKDLVDKEQIQGEALLQPKEGDKVGDVS
jgi:hypothetical protein